MNNTKNVAIAMSGGVDSSISAVLLKEMGYRVTGIFMKNWEEDDDDNNCNVADDYKDAKRVADKLGINLLTVNFSDKYWQLVFQRLIDGLLSGITPNPDIFCNKEIKFKYFYQHILSLGYDQLATGHYAKVENEDNKFKLKVANDWSKDQTYFLYMLQQDVLKNIIFPLENITKVEVKKIAKEFDLKISEKKESMGICFIGKKNFTKFIKQYLKDNPGDILDEFGNIIGQHLGLFNYTIGQRKGLGIGGISDTNNNPWFVLSKDVSSNNLVVTQDEKKLLYKGKLLLSSTSWVHDAPIANEKYSARFRHGGRLVPVLIEEINKRYYVILEEYERAVTIGQSAVIYRDNECLGGGIIKQLFQ